MNFNVMIVAERTFNELLREYIVYRHPKPMMAKIPKNEETEEKKEIYRRQHESSVAMWQQRVDDVLRSTMITDLTFECIYAAIDQAIGMIKDAEYLATDTTELVKRRKIIEQIRSILHISSAYPNDAIKRLNNLSKKLVSE